MKLYTLFNEMICTDPANVKKILTFLICAGLSTFTSSGISYPLDGRDYTGMDRLLGYKTLHESGTRVLPRGALLSRDDITLQLAGFGDDAEFDTKPKDPELQNALESIFKNRDPSYSLTIIDISDPDHLAWAGIAEDRQQNPGSVGKILCMIGLFDVLAQTWPDTDDRARVLRETIVRAGDWVSVEHHKVPRYNPETGHNSFSVVVPQDQFRLSEWIDHAVSASANGAGTIIWREAMLIKHFGQRYPVSWEESEAWFKNTPKSELGKIAQELISEPLARAGINQESIRQGSFWTAVSKNKVPGTTSYATARELARVMLRMEQGRLVDNWSSLEMKRYLYFTRNRYRYTYAPELNESAVYFKSGSLYECRQEEGFTCGKYMGNVKNFMNSVVIVESLDQKTRYIVALMSNVLKVNSAWDHSRIGAAIDEVVKLRTPVQIRDTGSAAEIKAAGSGN